MTAAHSSRSQTIGLAFAMAGAITFSGKAIIVKLSYRYGVDAVTIIMLRMLFALPFFLLMGFWAERRARAQGQFLSRRDGLGILGLGFVGYYLSSFLDFLGLQYITASLERLILYLNPTMVLLLGWWLYGRRITLRRMVAMAVSYAGVVLVFASEWQTSGDQVALGVALVLGSAMTYAVYLVYSGELVQRIGSLRLVGWATSVACACCIAQFVLLRPLDLHAVPKEVLVLALVNALACTVLPVWLVMTAIERIGSALTAQSGMVGPLATVALGVLLLDEPFNLSIIAGTALVLGGVFMVSRAPSR